MIVKTKRIQLYLERDIYELLWRTANKLGMRPRDLVTELLVRYLDPENMPRELRLKIYMRRIRQQLELLREAWRLYEMSRKLEFYEMKAQETMFEPIIVEQHRLAQEIRRILREIRELYKEDYERLEKEAYIKYDAVELLTKAYEHGMRYYCPEDMRFAPELHRCKDFGITLTKEGEEILPLCPVCKKPMQLIEDVLREHDIWCIDNRCYRAGELVIIDHEGGYSCLSPPDKRVCLEHVTPYISTDNEVYALLESGKKVKVSAYLRNIRLGV